MDNDLKKKRDYEFLKAFEKPTQIYRYLRLRHRYSPIYLSRNLSYLRGRAVRGKSLRQQNGKFDWIELSARTVEMQKNKTNNNHQMENLVFKFSGCFDEKVNGAQTAEVNIYLKNAQTQNKKKLHESIPLEINPQTCQSNLVQVTIPKEQLEFNSKYKSSQIIHMEVSYNGSTGDESSRPKKRKKISFETKINISDEKGRCILHEGEYELLLHNQAIEPNRRKIIDSLWQDIPFGFGSSFIGSPRLRFFLYWSNHEQLNSNQFTTANMYGSKATSGIKSSSSSLLSSASSSCSASSSSTTSLSTSGISSLDTPEEDTSRKSTAKKPNQMATFHQTACAELEHIHSHLVYRFIYNNNLSQQTEACDDFYCPWCYLNCMCLKSLLMHLQLCHNRFKFLIVKNNENMGILIDVRINENYQCSLSSKEIQEEFRSCDGLQRRSPQTKVLVNRRRSNKRPFSLMDTMDPMLLNDDTEMNMIESLQFEGHNRGYYRTTDNLPYTHRMDFDDDSEGEHDPGWLRKHTKVQIEDFTDVNEGEKEMMVKWNWHVMKFNFCGMSQMPLACETFIDINGDDLIKRNLYRNFVVHLCNLFDNGLLSAAQVADLSQRLQKKSMNQQQ